jgi:hypothetical protein
MKEVIIKREFIASKIDGLLAGKIARRDFGEEMFWYMIGEQPNECWYEYEKGYENLIGDILWTFSGMDDLDSDNVGYTPYCPSKEEFEYMRDCLRGNKKWITEMKDPKYIPELTKLLDISGSEVSFKSAEVLDQLGYIKKVVPQIIKMVRENRDMRAMFLLSKIGAKEVIPDIKKLLEHNEIKSLAAIALVELGAKGQIPKEIINDITSDLKGYKKESLFYDKAQSALKELEAKK